MSGASSASRRRLAGLAAAGLCAALAFLARAAHEERRPAALPGARPEAAAESFSPGMILATRFLGGFRAILTDFLWVRAGLAQENRRFWEVETLARLILTLQPRHAEVRTFIAWDLSFNVPGNNWPEDSPAEGEIRWHWIHKGIALLREGTEVQPRNPLFPSELGQLYLLKARYDRYFRERTAAEGRSAWETAQDWCARAAAVGRRWGLEPEREWFLWQSAAADEQARELAAAGLAQRDPVLLDRAALEFERAVSARLAGRRAFAPGSAGWLFFDQTPRLAAQYRGEAAACRRAAEALRKEVPPSPPTK